MERKKNAKKHIYAIFKKYHRYAYHLRQSGGYRRYCRYPSFRKVRPFNLMAKLYHRKKYLSSFRLTSRKCGVKVLK